MNEPGAGQYYGSVVAAPYAKQIVASMFEYLGLEPTNLTEDLQKINGSIKVPNVVGLSLVEAASLLKSMKLQYEIDGEDAHVIFQSVPPGEMLFENAIIVLKMGEFNYVN